MFGLKQCQQFSSVRGEQSLEPRDHTKQPRRKVNGAYVQKTWQPSLSFLRRPMDNRIHRVKTSTCIHLHLYFYSVFCHERIECCLCYV